MDTSDYPCEICGRPATCAVLDYSESSHNDILTREPYGRIHIYCNEHKRDSECAITFPSRESSLVGIA